MEPYISLITLGVKNLERSLRFYRDGLGLPTTRKAEQGIIFFQTRGVCLVLYPYEELARDVGENRMMERSKFTGITIAHNVRTAPGGGSGSGTGAQGGGYDREARAGDELGRV